MEHPIYQIQTQLIRRYPGLCLEFSRYVYKEYGITESRETFHANDNEIDKDWLKKQFEKLTSDQELAINSRVIWKSKIFHVPMIDFTNVDMNEDIEKRIRIVNDFVGEKIWVYDSGNSFHGYYSCLIDERRWFQFLGKCLLCNSPRMLPNQIIDPRWIGHSLEHGFSALRWSKNTSRHRSIPSLVNTREPTRQLEGALTQF